MDKAIICDIDGTIAKMVSRGPYDWDRVDEDEPKQAIIDVLHTYTYMGVEIILLTGRDGIAEKKTREWLADCDVPFDFLYIRKTGDIRKDTIIKREIYDNHIKDEFEVLFVLDDRDQVVKMWREDLGLTCLQVDYGDF